MKEYIKIVIYSIILFSLSFILQFLMPCAFMEIIPELCDETFAYPAYFFIFVLNYIMFKAIFFDYLPYWRRICIAAEE